MKNILLSTIAFSTLLSVTSTTLILDSASAIVITFDGSNYEITTVDGSFNQLQPQLEQQPWWIAILAQNGDTSLDAAISVDDSLNFPNFDFGQTRGPYFARQSGGSLPFAVNFVVGDGMGMVVGNGTTVGGLAGGIPMDEVRTYAMATEVHAVPEPLTILGAGVAIAFGAGFKRKLAKAKKK